VDALIIQDLGLAKLARTVAPDVELHASTQMTITSPEGLAFIESLFPLERAVLARELSVREIERFPDSARAHLLWRSSSTVRCASPTPASA
jgi:U32 family peptidase